MLSVRKPRLAALLLATWLLAACGQVAARPRATATLPRLLRRDPP
jgi:hypothetical protein